MSQIEQRYHNIMNQLGEKPSAAPLRQSPIKLLAVSKRQSAERIDALISLGHRHFAENQVQEAQRHWQERREAVSELTLHLIGPLQSNKVSDAVALFDVIHTIDREKIARAVKAECDKQKKETPCFIQVNIGDEPQKSGIAPSELPAFLALCQAQIGLNIIGLMAIAPAKVNPAPYFALMKKLTDRHQLSELSMGMSGDFEAALRFGATHIRLGTALFGERED